MAVNARNWVRFSTAVMAVVMVACGQPEASQPLPFVPPPDAGVAPLPQGVDAGPPLEGERDGGPPPVEMPDAGPPLLAEHQSCLKNGASKGTCESGLSCVLSDDRRTGSCKQVCQSSAVCKKGQTCKLGVFTNNQGACGYWKPLGSACDGFFTGPNGCQDPAGGSTLGLCVSGKCTNACAVEGTAGEATCPSGTVCHRETAVANDDWPGLRFSLCGPCTPSCGGKSCGLDGCGGTCGSCPTSSTCTAIGTCSCVPSCSGAQCGADQCGGSCGSCSAGQTCSSTQQCVCAPQCAGKQCGPDGCGGTCGTCTGSKSCSGSGACICTPNCGGKQCGSDGCGGTCGSCTGGTQCNSSGTCSACTPSCNGKQCGPNGCGGSCGSCPGTTTCDSGSCVQLPCNLVTQTGCLAGQRCVFDGSERVCTFVGPGLRGDSCSLENCGAGLGCDVAGGVCREYCNTDSDCVDGVCALDHAVSATVRMCSNRCTPTQSPSGCKPGTGCTVFNTTLKKEVADCRDLSVGTSGSSCSHVEDCFTGYSCLGGQCRKLCERGTICGGGSSCQAVSGWNTYGVCP